VIYIKKTLESVRKKMGLTQEQMASMLDISVSSYNQYETGARSVPTEIAQKICKILDVDISCIFLPTKFTVSKT